MTRNISRRDFVQQGTLATAALAAPFAAAGASRRLSGQSEPGIGSDAVRRRSEPSRVIVIGAGLAGLAAAYELVEAGQDVTVLEARNRAGGRVYTLRAPFADGLYAEAGAMFAGGLVGWWADRLGVEIFRPEPNDLASLYHIRGHRIPMGGNREVDWPVDLTPEEREVGLRGLWQLYIAPAREELVASTNLEDSWPPPSLGPYDSVSWADFLRSRGASEGAIAILRLSVQDLYGDGFETVSAANFLAGAVTPPPARSIPGSGGLIKGGSDNLPRAFTERLSDRILYGVPVVRIEQTEPRVRIVFDRAGQHQALEADYVICTIPFPALRDVEFASRLSSGKQRAIDELQYSSITRIYLQTRRRFWEDEGLNGGALTDLPVPRVLVHPLGLRPTRGILEAHVGKARARELAAASEDDRITFALTEMERIHPGVQHHFEGGASHSWVSDPWTIGGYSSPAPGQILDLLPHVASVEGRIHFAGEHTSPYSASMGGALESGNRAAKEVIDRAE